MTAQIPTGRSTYVPGRARVGQPTPQSHPDRFSSEDLLAEAKYLVKMNGRHGSSALRTMAYRKLLRIIDERGDTQRLAEAQARA